MDVSKISQSYIDGRVEQYRNNMDEQMVEECNVGLFYGKIGRILNNISIQIEGEVERWGNMLFEILISGFLILVLFVNMLDK